MELLDDKVNAFGLTKLDSVWPVLKEVLVNHQASLTYLDVPAILRRFGFGHHLMITPHAAATRQNNVLQHKYRYLR